MVHHCDVFSIISLSYFICNFNFALCVFSALCDQMEDRWWPTSSPLHAPLSASTSSTASFTATGGGGSGQGSAKTAAALQQQQQQTMAPNMT
jgi:hypothetical protein